MMIITKTNFKSRRGNEADETQNLRDGTKWGCRWIRAHPLETQSHCTGEILTRKINQSIKRNAQAQTNK